MKKVYTKPVMAMEEFVANTAVAQCTVSGGISYKFDCMAGRNTDTEYVIADALASGCGKKIGYAAGYRQAWDKSKSGDHSNNNPSIATWGKKDGKNTVSYSGNVDGLVYCDADGRSNYNLSVWSTDGSYVVHSTDSGLMHHQVAPVVNSYSVKASW